MSDIIIEPIEQYGISTQDRPKQLFSRVGIVGCGTVGQNIAILISQKEVEVVFIEISEEKVKEAYIKMEAELDNQIEHWSMTPGEKRAIMSRISGGLNYDRLRDCDLVIESISSKAREYRLSSRKKVFKNIEEHVKPECIIATNSATLVITELSADLQYKSRCVSMHFLTNAPKARMIEIVRGLYTSDEVFTKVIQFIKMLGKEPIYCEESPGLISIRVFVAQLNEACAVLMEGIGTIDSIDKTMRMGYGQSLGPFEMADKIGLDKVERWMENLYTEFGDKKYKASPFIKRLVRANQFGRITGKGFYRYDNLGRKIN